MTMTSGGRLDYFLRTIASLKNVDMEHISKCVVIDDGSSIEDINTMRDKWVDLFPDKSYLTIRNDQGGEFRHQHSMELWRSVVIATATHEFVFHCEDDFEFQPTKDYPLDWAITLLKDHDWIGQVCFSKRRHAGPDLHLSKFWCMTQENSPDFAPSRVTFNPSVWRVDSIRATGGFRRVPGFEVEYGNRWAGRGYVTAYHPVGFAEHIGIESCYEKYGSVR